MICFQSPELYLPGFVDELVSMTFEDFVNIGLYFGAFFQIVCIAALIVLPSKPYELEEPVEEEEESDSGKASKSSSRTTSGLTHRKLTKPEKRKRK